MKLIDMIGLALVLCLFSSLAAGEIFQLRELDCELEQVRDKVESTQFISASFCNVCTGESASSLEDWGEMCLALWQLDWIRWGECETENTLSDERLMRGEWSGSCSRGEVYCRMRRN